MSVVVPTPKVWMSRICSGSVPTVLALYREGAVLVPTYSKRDLPGAGKGVLRGRAQLAHYFERFMSKEGLCGSIDTMVVQPLGGVTVYSGLYTFHWLEGRRREKAQARYTFVVVNRAGTMGNLVEQIVNHHSSETP